MILKLNSRSIRHPLKGDSAEEENSEDDDLDPEETDLDINVGEHAKGEVEFPDDEEGEVFLQNMEEAELIIEDEETFEEEEEEMVKEEKWNDMDLTHGDFSMAELRTKLYTIEEESSENEENDEESEGEAEDWREINRLQGLSELQRYFLLLADGQQEFSKQF